MKKVQTHQVLNLVGRVILLITGLIGLFTPVQAETLIQNVKRTTHPLDLSSAPSTSDIMAAGQLGGPLFPTHDVKDKSREAEINLSFGHAIEAWNRHEFEIGVELFRKHVEKYPDSPWLAEAVLHIGCDAQYEGRYSEAEDTYRWILDTYKGRNQVGALMLVNKARLRLGNQMVLQNNFDEATALFGDLKKEGLDWRDRTYASHWIQRLSLYKTHYWAILNCGIKALARVMEKEGNKSGARQVMQIRPDSLKGQSIKDLRSIAARYGYSLTTLRLTAGELKDIPLPAIVHLERRNKGDSGHYWVVEAMNNGTLNLFDPQSGRIFRQTFGEFAKEWSGNVLILSREAVSGERLSEDTIEDIYGGCCGIPRQESDLGDPGIKEDACGSPKWAVNMINMNLYITDTPLWYSSPIGPPVNIKLSYNSQSATTFHEPFGNKWQFNYGSYLVVDTGGQVTIFMPDGRRDIFTPDGTGKYIRPFQIFNSLTKIAENHFELRFPYDMVYVYKIPSGTNSLQPFLVEIKDPYGQKLSMGYDSGVRLKTITDAKGRVTTLTYNNEGLVTQVTDPFGRTATFQYDPNQNLIKITDMGGYWSSLTYDKDSYITGIEDEKGKQSFYIEPADGIDNDLNPYPAPGGVMWENYRITVTNLLGGKEEYYYNGFGSYSWYVSPMNYVEYTPSFNNETDVPKTKYLPSLTSLEKGEIGFIFTPEQSFVWNEYDPEGNRIKITDGNGNMTFFTYNAMGRVISATDAKGTVRTTTYAANGVDPQRFQNGLGTVELGYNSTHDLTSFKDLLGHTSTFSYNQYGQVTSEINALGVIKNYIYDSNHQLQRIEKDGKTIESFTYDPIGRIKTRTDDKGLTFAYDYNNLDEITTTTYPDGKFITFSYASCCPRLPESITDRGGRTTGYRYDELKRLSEITNPEGGVTKYAYDANGNMVQLIDPNNNVTAFAYDFDNRLIQRTYPDGKSLKYSYWGNGLLQSFKNGRGISASFNYDNNNNLSKISYSDDTPEVSYEYDQYDRLVRMQVGADTYLYSYDANSRLIGLDGPWSNDKMTLQYDAAGKKMGLSAEGGQNVTYTYDALNRITTVQAGSNVYAYAYSGASPLVQSLTRPNGSVTHYQYDLLKRLTGISNQTSSDSIINKYAYTYNERDLRSSETVTNGTPMTFQNGVVTYSYTNSNEVSSSSNPGRTYIYDADGNMTQGYTPEGYAFAASYDAENRLKSIEYADNLGIQHRTDYYYRDDPLLTKSQEYENGSLIRETRYVRDELLVLQERDSENNIINEFTWGLGLGGGIGGLLHLDQLGHHYSYFYDGKGNVTALTDASQSVVASYNYDPFGEVMSKSGSLDQPFTFSTKPYHSKTGLSYYGYRFYVPAIGRWMTKDPLGEKGGINLYGFVGNNPISSIDPKGLGCREFTDEEKKKAREKAACSAWDILDLFCDPGPLKECREGRRWDEEEGKWTKELPQYKPPKK